MNRGMRNPLPSLFSGVAGLNERDRVILIQAALFVSAFSTLLQLFPFIRFKNFRLGSALPVIMGISFAYVPSMQAIAESFDIGTILGAQLVGGVVAILVGIAVKKDPCFCSLPLSPEPWYSPSAFPYIPLPLITWPAGHPAPPMGSWQNWLVAFFTLAVVVGLNHFAKGFLKLASILVGIIAGYIAAAFFGLVDSEPAKQRRNLSAAAAVSFFHSF